MNARTKMSTTSTNLSTAHQGNPLSLGSFGAAPISAHERVEIPAHFPGTTLAPEMTLTRFALPALHSVVTPEATLAEMLLAVKTPFRITPEGLLICHQIADGHRRRYSGADDVTPELAVIICAIAHRVIGAPTAVTALLNTIDTLSTSLRCASTEPSLLQSSMAEVARDADALEQVDIVLSQLHLVELHRAKLLAHGEALTQNGTGRNQTLSDSISHYFIHAILLLRTYTHAALGN